MFGDAAYQLGKVVGSLLVDLGVLVLLVVAIAGVIWWNKLQAAKKPPGPKNPSEPPGGSAGASN